jgi:hypothetical protein
MIELLARHKLDDVDLPALLLGKRAQVVIGEHNRSVTLLVRLVDVLVLHNFVADLASTLVTDASTVFVVHLVQAQVVVFCCAVYLHRHVDEPKGDRALPNGSHLPIMRQVSCVGKSLDAPLVFRVTPDDTC